MSSNRVYYLVCIRNLLQWGIVLFLCIDNSLSGLFENVEDTEQIATSLTDSGGVYFVPAFSGLQVGVLLPLLCISLCILLF